jgi:antitoxin Phd
MVKVTSVEAQNRFGQLIDMAQGETVTVTRHGRPAAFSSPHDTEELLDARRRRSRAVAELEAWVAQAAKGRKAGKAAAANKLTDEEVNCMVHESR